MCESAQSVSCYGLVRSDMVRLIMREWLIGQFRSHLPLKHLKVGRLFVMDYCENSSKVVSLKVHCLHCTGAIRQFETNFG